MYWIVCLQTWHYFQYNWDACLTENWYLPSIVHYVIISLSWFAFRCLQHLGSMNLCIHRETCRVASAHSIYKVPYMPYSLSYTDKWQVLASPVKWLNLLCRQELVQSLVNPASIPNEMVRLQLGLSQRYSPTHVHSEDTRNFSDVYKNCNAMPTLFVCNAPLQSCFTW